MSIDALWPLFVGMAIQTFVLVQTNKSQIESVKESVREVRGMAERAHHRIDEHKDQFFSILKSRLN